MPTHYKLQHTQKRSSSFHKSITLINTFDDNVFRSHKTSIQQYNTGMYKIKSLHRNIQNVQALSTQP